MKLLGRGFYFLFVVLALNSIALADVNEAVRESYLKIENDKETQLKESLNLTERQHLFNFVRNHKVAALTQENLDKYDPTREIGYCYGRAMAVHLIARRMGLKPQSIRKLFIVGDLRSGKEAEWRFHVTTVVLGSDKVWYAVDPLLTTGVGRNRPETIEGWAKAIRKIWDKKNKAHLYLVSSNSVIPDIRVYPGTESDETGDNIIDLSFHPQSKDGFLSQQSGGEKLFVVGESQQEKYFLQAREKVDRDQFDFTQLKLVIVKESQKTPVDYDYHGYFKDLIDEISSTPYAKNSERRLAGVAANGTEIHGTEIHGTEIHGTEIHGTEIHYGSPRPKISKGSK